MALSAFDDKSHEPTQEDLGAMLGRTASHWDRIREALAHDHAPTAEEWKYTGAKYGWSLRVKRRDRVIVYLIPQEGSFLAGIVLGERAVTAAHDAVLPDAVLAEIDAARPYAEGRGIRLPVRNRRDVEVVLALAAVKMKH